MIKKREKDDEYVGIFHQYIKETVAPIFSDLKYNDEIIIDHQIDYKEYSVSFKNHDIRMSIMFEYRGVDYDLNPRYYVKFSWMKDKTSFNNMEDLKNEITNDMLIEIKNFIMNIADNIGKLNKFNYKIKED